jgi:hypothetical protein
MNLAQPAKFNGIFSDIIQGINAGVKVLGAVYQPAGAPKPKTCIGAGDIDPLFAVYDTLRAQGDPATVLNALAQMNTYLSSLSACHGQEAYYAQAKGDVASDITIFQTRLAANVAALGTTTSTASLVTTTISPTTGLAVSTIGGIPTTYLLYGGIGLMMILLVTKK